MKKTKKGLTLVEVIVAIAVFAVITLALFSTYLGIRKLSFRQEEYVRLEMVCYDINYYWDAYGDEWVKEYLKSNITDNDFINNWDSKSIPLGSDFKPTNGSAAYNVSFEYSGDGENKQLTITSVHSLAGKVYIENLHCGKKGE